MNALNQTCSNPDRIPHLRFNQRSYVEMRNHNKKRLRHIKTRMRKIGQSMADRELGLYVLIMFSGLVSLVLLNF